MFTAHLINNPFSDPGVYVGCKYRNEAILFDLGDIHNLPSRKILKVRYIFISHTHMDHFVGFDHLLRVCLGRDHHITLFGPPGFIRNVESKLNGYTWNLVGNYSNNFVIDVVEIQKKVKITRRYKCQGGFKPETIHKRETFDGTLIDKIGFSVRGVFLDHKIPSIAFSLEEKKHINVKKNVLLQMGLSTGKWLSELKGSILRGDPDNTPIVVTCKKQGKEKVERIISLGILKDKVVKITEGQKISYVTDAIYSPDNARKIMALARFSDKIFIEASFLEEDMEKATEKYHLTAKQAGILAREAGARNIVIFHFSPKYKGCGDMLTEEALRSFRDG